jgi:hypothetical protein
MYTDAISLKFAIGERAMLLQTPDGNILWDLIAFLDSGTVSLVCNIIDFGLVARGLTPQDQCSRRAESDCHLAPTLLHDTPRVGQNF